MKKAGSGSTVDFSSLSGLVERPQFATTYNATEFAIHGLTQCAMHWLNRQGRSEEVVAVAAFLASDDASIVTGSDVLVDGSCTAK